MSDNQQPGEEQQPTGEPEASPNAENAPLVLSAEDFAEEEALPPAPPAARPGGAPLVLDKDELLAEPESPFAPAPAGGALFERGQGFLPVRMLAACTKVGKPYVLLFKPNNDGTMSCIGDEPLPEGAGFDPNDFNGQMGREEVIAKGGFLMDQYQGCPYCGSRQYALCSCGTAMCTGGLRRGLLRSTLKCPVCGNEGTVDKRPVTRGVQYGGGGKSGKFRSK